MEVYTIGFGKHSAAQFFSALESAKIQKLVDVRLHNQSQLAGFTKRDDLRFFLERLLGASYQHRLELAPTSDLLSDYRSHKLTWAQYERNFRDLLADRRIEDSIMPYDFSVPTALLCSEPTANQCHRRVVLEYLRETSIPELRAIHL